MSLQGLTALVSQAQEFTVIKAKTVAQENQHLVGLTGSQKSLVAAVTAGDEQTTLIISHNQQQADSIAQDLRNLLPGRIVSVHNPHELLPHEEAATDWELRKSRLEVIRNLQTPGSIISTSVQALQEGLMNPKKFYQQKLDIDLDSIVELGALGAKLVELGYEHVEMVDGFGQFSIRGGIIDIFPYTNDHPIRIELFDEEIDSIRIFDVQTQISVEKLFSITIYPAVERLYEFTNIEEIRDQIWADAKLQSQQLAKLEQEQVADDLLAKIAHHLELMEDRVNFPGIDQYYHYFSQGYSLIDYLPVNSIIIANEPARIREQAKEYTQEIGETVAGLLFAGKALPSISKNYIEWNDLWDQLHDYTPTIFVSMLDKRIPEMEHATVQQMSLRAPEHFHANLDNFVKKLHQYRKDLYRILLVVATEDRGKRLVEFLQDNDIPAQYVADVSNQLKIGNCLVTKGNLESGFEYPSYKLVVYTDLEIYGRRRVKQRVNRTEAHLRLAENDLRVGDYVVHVTHGIGQYLGIESLEVEKSLKDYFLVRFAGKDRLYVPTDQIDLLQRYVGMNDQEPKLSKLGGAEWSRVKKRVKDSVKEMAEGLIKLYAEREAVKGYAYPPDTPWQKEFEDAFSYEETTDQMQAIVDVKADMEKTKPMDRLLCGDVGYGKTEVAIRAAFKAVNEGKQVAVLVPTTILAQQHSRTFIDRFENYPVNIGVLSRFQSAAQQKKVIEGLKVGTVDIVIGTHRLLSKDIVYHDLGLVVVDEEQRFGVAQKERLKEICKNVDVLTLSATPIPRTLHMSMVGVRDMSLIETPPEDRFPIRTYVLEWDEQTIAQAINRELGRNGQVYFVYNRVQGIEKIYRKLQNLIPDARIAIAHGQMDENQLERIMVDFYNAEYDILLCTTIIETGMDIGNVNTLIVYAADYLGLAQLYQLRGRVGRTNRVAYAYFTYKKDKILTEEAEKRLQAIKEFSELGSGIKIAMRDLEIRGAGNILGPEQHGFISSVGFELYCKLLDEAIRQLKGDEVAPVPDPVLDLSVSAYISDAYVSDPKQKVELYKKMAAVESIADADNLEAEIEDRFGDLPEPVRNLVQIARIKVLAKQCAVTSIVADKGVFVVRMLPLEGERSKYQQLVRRHHGRVAFISSKTPQLKIKVRDMQDSEALNLVRYVLDSLNQDNEQKRLAGNNE